MITNTVFRVIDISNPSKPKQVGFNPRSDNACNIEVSGNYGYIVDQHGLLVMNLSNPVEPVVVGGWNSWRQVTNIAISGNYAYITLEGTDLVVIDISEPRSPRAVGLYITRGNTEKIAVDRKYLYVTYTYVTYAYITEYNYRTTNRQYSYVANNNYGLEIIDISIPNEPKQAGVYNGYIGNIVVSDNYAYIVDTWGLRIIDISKPEKLVEVESHHTGQAHGLSVRGKYIYVADGSSGLKIWKQR
jgi:hypothetical protein